MKNILGCFIGAALLLACQKNTGDAAVAATVKTDTLKQKDGSVLTFQSPAQPLIEMPRDQTAYSQNYKKRLKKIAEYYIAESRQSLVKFQKENPKSSLGYSYEENNWENVQYTQIGIFNKSGANASTLQWLFYDPKSQKLYEFDLNTKKLQEFK